MTTFETTYIKPSEHICHTRSTRFVDGSGMVIKEDPFPECVGENSDHVLLTVDSESGDIIDMSIYFFVEKVWRKKV